VKGKAPIFFVAALALLAIVETANALLAPWRVAGEADWAAAAAEVRAGFRDGDLIVFAPYWADQHGRAVLGDKMTLEMAGHADTDRYRRIWQVSIRGAQAPDVGALKAAHRSQHGKVAVALFEKDAVEISYDFTAHADEARVTQSTIAGGNETPCYRNGEGFRCGALQIEPRTLEIDYQPRRGILAPPEGGRSTRLEFADVPMGRTLVGYTGIHDYFSRKNADGPVDFKVLLDGQERLAQRTVNADGYKRFSVDTAALAGQKHTVRFEISAPDPAWRTFGFHVESRK
jgi:hypothetical protein